MIFRTKNISVKITLNERFDKISIEDRDTFDKLEEIGNQELMNNSEAGKI